jgi:hypothetical protein
VAFSAQVSLSGKECFGHGTCDRTTGACACDSGCACPASLVTLRQPRWAASHGDPGAGGFGFGSTAADLIPWSLRRTSTGLSFRLCCGPGAVRLCAPACNAHDWLVCRWEGDSCAAKQTDPPSYRMTDAPTIPPTEKMCSPGCPERYLGDRNCDRVCMTEACQFDGGDCGSVTAEPPVEVCACPLSWLGDATCHAECNTAACQFDRGDCATTTAPVPLTQSPSLAPTDAPSMAPTAAACSPACLPAWQGDGSCQVQCNSADCKYDGGDCPQQTTWCAAGCDPVFLGDGFCDSPCNAAKCNWDNGDCRSTTNPLEVLAALPEARACTHARLRTPVVGLSSVGLILVVVPCCM